MVPFDGSKFEIEQVWYESKDRTRVPMFLFHKKGLTKTGPRRFADGLRRLRRERNALLFPVLSIVGGERRNSCRCEPPRRREFGERLASRRHDGKKAERL